LRPEVFDSFHGRFNCLDRDLQDERMNRMKEGDVLSEAVKRKTDSKGGLSTLNRY
jgi:hypothetical protein